MKCSLCSLDIPLERLEALPKTSTCVKCSGVKGVQGFMVFSHKTAPELVLIPAEESESIRQARRANKRSR